MSEQNKLKQGKKAQELLFGPKESFLLIPGRKPRKAKILGFRPERHDFELLIRKLEMPFSSKLDEELDWIAESFGFFKPVDRQKTAALVFRTLVKASELSGKALSSTAISRKLGMSRGAVLNHLRNLMDSGLIVRKGTLYTTCRKSLLGTVSEVEEETERIFERLRKVAKKIDEEFETEA